MVKCSVRIVQTEMNIMTILHKTSTFRVFVCSSYS